MLLAQTEEVRRLFTTDKATRDAFGGPPHTSDLHAEMENTIRYNAGMIDVSRQRIRLGQVMTDTSGAVIGYMSVSLVQNALPTSHERVYVWGKKPPPLVSGVFVRKLVVKCGERGAGYGAILFAEAKYLARELGLYLFCDTLATNMGMRSFLRDEGCTTNIFWLTQKKTVMVRYIL